MKKKIAIMIFGLGLSCMVSLSAFAGNATASVSDYPAEQESEEKQETSGNRFPGKLSVPDDIPDGNNREEQDVISPSSDFGREHRPDDLKGSPNGFPSDKGKDTDSVNNEDEDTNSANDRNTKPDERNTGNDSLTSGNKDCGNAWGKSDTNGNAPNDINFNREQEEREKSSHSNKEDRPFVMNGIKSGNDERFSGFRNMPQKPDATGRENCEEIPDGERMPSNGFRGNIPSMNNHALGNNGFSQENPRDRRDNRPEI